MSRNEDALRLALETGGSTRTVQRWLKGDTMSPFVEYALTVAAAKLKIKRVYFNKVVKK